MSRKNSITSTHPAQMSFPVSEEEYVPLLAADEFGFNLPYLVANNGKLYFRLRSWVAGCLGEDRALDAVRNMRRKGVFSKHTPSDVLMITEDIGGQSIEFEYVSEELIYRITEDMRSIKERPVIKAIKDYLAKSGVEISKQRREQQQVIAPPKNSEERKYIAKQRVYRGLDKNEATKMLQVRRDTKATFVELMSVVKQVVISPEYWRYPEEEYITLFGYTTNGLKALLETDSIRDAFTDTQLKGLQFLEVALRDKLRNMAGVTNAQALQELRNIAGKIRAILDDVSPNFREVKRLK